MALRVNILSASGAIDDMLSAELLHENLLETGDRLLPAGHGIDSTEEGFSRSRALGSTRSINRRFFATSFPNLGHARKPLLNPGIDHVSG
jgi:hypothetical protein